MLWTPANCSSWSPCARPSASGEKLPWWEASIEQQRKGNQLPAPRHITAPLAEDILGRYLDPLTINQHTLLSQDVPPRARETNAFFVCVYECSKGYLIPLRSPQQGTYVKTKIQVSSVFLQPPNVWYSRQIHFISSNAQNAKSAPTPTLLSATIHTCFWSSALKKWFISLRILPQLQGLRELQVDSVSTFLSSLP